MTDRYVRNAAPSSPHDGSDWAHGYVTLAAAVTASAAGDRVFVSEDHTESQATTLTITSAGTAPNPVHIICVNHSGTVPPVATDLRTTAVLNQTGNAMITINGGAEFYGIIFNGGTTTGTSAGFSLAQAANNRLIFKNCAFVFRNGSATYMLAGANTGTTFSEITFDNTTVTFGSSASQVIYVGGHLIWRNTASALAWTTQPTNIFSGSAGRGAFVALEGVDLSNFTNTMFSVGAVYGRYIIKDCKLNASATMWIATGTTFRNPAGDIIRSDSGNTNYKLARSDFEGDLTTDTTTIRTGGANDGTTGFSWKIVTTANANSAFPFICPPIRIWNEVTTGTISLTMYGAGAAIPYNDEFAFEAEVLGDASFPICSKVTSEMTLLDSHAALDTDSTSAWAGSPATKWSKTMTLSPRQKGYIYIYARAIKPSTTFYIDPKPIVASGPAISRSMLGENELFAGVARSIGMRG